MPNTGLSGPYSLTTEEINRVVTSTSPGAYALGKYKDGTFYVSYVGRSDKCVCTRLNDWAGTKYTHFKFGYFGSAKAAFLKECQMFHDFGGVTDLDNKIHPDRPKNSDWECPVCTIFD